MEASCFTSEILWSLIWKHLTAKWNTLCHRFPGLQAMKTPAAITCTSGHYSMQFCTMASALLQDLTSSGAQLTWWMRSHRRKGSAGNCKCERRGWAEEEKAEATVSVPHSVPPWTGLCCLYYLTNVSRTNQGLNPHITNKWSEINAAAKHALHKPHRRQLLRCC